MRKDERLKTIYETAAQMIVRSESAWKDYLTFASHIHKHDFDTTLLVYAQNDSVTALASTAQWNRIGRYVNRGAAGIAVCEYENAKLTLSYLFDISQTNGREVRLTDWQLDEDMKSELAQRFIRADNLQADTFAEVVYALAAEGTAEKYETCLRSIKANAQNHMFSELPESGVEAQLISLLTDSAAYLIGKRCGLPDEDIIIKDGMQTIFHFNTIPLLAALGNTVIAIARERLIEMELTIKTIQQERSRKHEGQTEYPVHRERRNPVSEPANIQRSASRSAAGTVRDNGAGISERATSRPVYNFENGWQLNGDHAQGTRRSDGEDRGADTADAQKQPAADESRNRPADRGHTGEDAPSEQPETGSGGNRPGGNRADSEISDTKQPAKTEPSKDGSVSLPKRQMSDVEIRRHYLYVLTSTNLYPSKLHNAMRVLLSEQPVDHDWREKGKVVGRLFAEYGDREYPGEVLYRTQLRGKAGISMYFGDNGYTYLPWATVANIVNALIENDEYPAFQQEELQAKSHELPEYAEVLVIEKNDAGKDQDINFDESRSPVEERTVSPPSVLRQMSFFSDQSEEENDNRVRDEMVLLLGNNVAGGKQRIYDFALTNPTVSAFVSFLKKEYGIGGRSYNLHGISFVNYDSKGIRYDLVGGDRITLSWVKVAGIIQRLVNEGRYLDVPGEQVQEPEPTADKPDKEIKILEEVTGAHHGQIDMVMTAYKGEESVGYLQYSLYEDLPHISLIETMPPYRRQGIATRLLQQLQAQYPEAEIEWGMLTDEGKALYDAITYSVENEDYNRTKDDLEDITTELSKYEFILDNGGMLSPIQAMDMDELESIQYRLETELRDLHPTRVYIRAKNKVQDAQVTEPEPVQQPVQEKDTVSAPPIPQHFRYTTDMDLYPRGDKSKYQANITAIKLLRQIETERRQATPEEQAVLARYCGWGGLANAFNEKSEKWAHEYQELKSVLTEDEYRAARESTLTAYYTDPEMIRYIYQAIESFGFHGGADRKILDKTTPRLIQFHTFKNAANPPFLGGFSIFSIVAA